MRVWLVGYGDYENHSVIGVFSSKEKAEEFVDQYNKSVPSGFSKSEIDGDFEIDLTPELWPH